MSAPNDRRLEPKLVAGLYTEAMVLADEARGYFGGGGREDRGRLEPLMQVTFACEALKITTRLMHIIAWLLTHRAIENGEIRPADGRLPEFRLGDVEATGAEVTGRLPDAAAALASASEDLFARVRRLDDGLAQSAVPAGARALQSRLLGAF